MPSWLVPLRSALDHKQARVCLLGAHGPTSACAVTLLDRLRRHSHDCATPWVVLTASDESAERIFNDLHFFHTLMGQSVEGLAWFPEWETLPYEATAPHVALIAHRMTTLHRLLVKPPTILVTSVAAAMHRVIPRSLFEEAVIRLFSIVKFLQKRARAMGYPKTHGFAAGNCRDAFCHLQPHCQDLMTKNGCRHPEMSSYSMESCGLDVFLMAARAGWDHYPVGGSCVPEKVPQGNLMGLVLIK